MTSNLSLSLFALIICALGSGCQNRSSEAAPASEDSPLEEISDVGTWMTYFHKNPDPERVVPAIRLASETGFWGESGHIGVAFFAEVFRLYPDRVEGWASEIHDLSEDHRHWICIAVWWSGIPGWEGVLKSFLPEAGEDFHQSLQNLLEGEPGELLESSLTPENLDSLWATYFASGEFKYIRKIVSALALNHEYEDGIDNLLTYGAAAWSISSNARQHPEIRRYLEKLADGELSGVEEDELTKILDSLPAIIEEE